ncbi:transcriptional regulator [Priestia megaterium]|nr:transcriptional regulator [Priestia megaterium]
MIRDNLILEHYGLNELNFDTIKSYRERFSEVKKDHPWNVLETKEFLYKIGAWGKVRDTHKEGVTLAGLLMFSEERIITEVLPQYFLEYRERDQNGNWSKRFTSQDGTWSGNIFDFYFYVQEQMSDYGLDEEIASSLREIFTNMLVHAQYDGEGGGILERTDHSYICSNPGLFRTSAEQAFLNNISNLRNPHLFKLFSLLNLCQRAGAGLKKVHDTWAARNWELPAIEQDVHLERTSVTLNVSPVKRQEQPISHHVSAHGHQSITGNKIEDVEQGQKQLQKPVETNSCNKNKNSYNIEIEPLLQELEGVIIGDNLYNNGTNYYNKESHSYNNEEDSYNIEGLEENQGEMDANIEKQLWNLSELARKKKRLNPEKMESIILDLCREKPLMLKDLAYLLERTPDGVRNNYLSKLLQQGKLQLKYPNQPNHPKQAYLTHKK